MQPITVAAISTPQDGAVTSTGATVSQACTVNGVASQPCGAASFASGTATIGPLTPQLGRDIRIILKGTWVGSFQVGTSVDGCTTINPLTVGGAAWGGYTANANEVVDTANLSGVGYCATATVSSGTLSYALRQ